MENDTWKLGVSSMRFSIIIPVYNAAHTIRRCVESIERNSFQDFEILLVEDGSLDSSWQQCLTLSAEYSNIRAFQNDRNRGVSYTRNQGLKNAVGEYTMFVDSDDWVEPTYYARFDEAIRRYAPFFAVCGFVNHDEKQNRRTDIYQWDDFTGIREAPVRTELKKLFDRNLLQQLWNKAFLTEIIKENGLTFDESISIGEDFRFVLQYLKASKAVNMVQINAALYHYMRDQAGSLMFHIGYESVEEPLKNLRSMYELLGWADDEIADQMQTEREKQKRLYAYLIMHNAGMPLKEKRRLILQLDNDQGKKLFAANFEVWIKESVFRKLNGNNKH